MLAQWRFVNELDLVTAADVQLPVAEHFADVPLVHFADVPRVTPPLPSTRVGRGSGPCLNVPRADTRETMPRDDRSHTRSELHNGREGIQSCRPHFGRLNHSDSWRTRCLTSSMSRCCAACRAACWTAIISRRAWSRGSGGRFLNHHFVLASHVSPGTLAFDM